MIKYDNVLFDEILDRLKSEKNNVINVPVAHFDILLLQYFLTKNYYYAAIIDDYPLKISDKESLLEALYYQLKLITVHDLNWDAIQEGLNDALNNFLEFEGICLLFRQGNLIKNILQEEFRILDEIICEINSQIKCKKIVIVLL